MVYQRSTHEFHRKLDKLPIKNNFCYSEDINVPNIKDGQKQVLEVLKHKTHSNLSSNQNFQEI